MKKIKYSLYILGIVGISFGLSSCSDDLLDQNPSYEIPLSETSIDTEAKMLAVLNGMYSELGNASAFGSRIPIIGEVLSDNVYVSNQNDGRFVAFNQASVTTSNADISEIYNGLYDVVALANAIINSKVEETSNVKAYKAQAHIARGFAFFTLTNFFSASPASGVNQDFGIPMYTGPYNPNENYGRSTLAENYTQIIEDLKAGIVDENNTVSNKGYLSSTAAKLLLAKVYLTQGDNTNAILYADRAVSEAPASFQLIGKSGYVNYFSSNSSGENHNQPETVWEINMSEENNPLVNYAIGNFYDPTGSKRSLVVRRWIYDSLEDSDIRKELMTPDEIHAVDNPLGVFSLKQPLKIDEVSFVNNVKVLRLTEAKFIKWEAMAKSGQGSTALTELNTFATERGGATYTGDALTAILSEKQKEFITEGQRFFDLKRNNLTIERQTNCMGTCSITPDNPIYVFPIPSDVINNNTLMKQYPGWGN